jgi:ketosteroid isomerase-like protein
LKQSNNTARVRHSPQKFSRSFVEKYCKHPKNILLSVSDSKFSAGEIQMKLALFATVFFVFAVGLASGQSLKRDEKLEQEIRKLDLAHAEAILKRDTAALDKLLAKEVVTNHPTNKVVHEREGIFELIRNGTINYSSFERVPETFLFYKDMVVVMGHETLVMAKDGKTVNRRYTNIWMKQNGKWLLNIRHAHIVCSD